MDRIFPFIITYMCASVGLAFVIPENVLDNYAWLRAVTDVAGAIVPSAKKYSTLSHFPQTAVVYLSVGWASVPALAYFFWRKLDFSFERARAAAPRVSRITWTLAPLAMLSGIAFIAVYAPTPEALASSESGVDLLVARLVSESKFALGFFGGWIFLGSAFLIVLSLETLLASTRLSRKL